MGYDITRRDRIRWKIQKAVKRGKWKVENGIEWVLRKALLLGRDDEDDYFVKNERGYYTIDSDVLKDRIENSHIRFHGKPRREHYLNQFLRFVFHRWYQPLIKFKRRMGHKWDWWLFFYAREWQWDAWHYINRSGEEHIDGHVTAKVGPFKVSRTLDICSMDCLKHDFLGQDNDEIHYHDINKYGSWGFPTLMVVKDKIMTEDIDKVLRQWYNDQVKYKYRHWTWEGDEPNIIIGELKYMEDPCEKCGLDAWGCQGHYGEDKDEVVSE